MEVKVTKLTDVKLMGKAIESTVLKDIHSSMSLSDMYQCRHSPMKTQLFWVELIDIYSYVSTHLVRHKIGVEHFVSSRREDRGGSKDDGRYSLVKHSMLLNASALIEMAEARLCFQASPDTTNVVMMIKKGVANVDAALSLHMVPRCVAVKQCRELRSCGYWEANKERICDE